ncbi:methyl-accepting chemotaxis sensory transducer [Solidesulfovibrio carbinoliphilus subsp. oakridgensis]|uniref:Methyl-accepting chemotaxis sensory transducer n=1 Tax=Solidesulfovibrio carbinoliphilus subsp. oakridgensis TaxID=694327 RepID=G7Q9G8_9BACT|nr:methyl-accepting chemotaxis protein [Solidesulfovibrio carbinoliphilus]EHJ48608.1 methyl-accepting chemotaxis sensory transducer [Solidesulfovibrio carbinoliphilus subsp. oakridgensis]
MSKRTHSLGAKALLLVSLVVTATLAGLFAANALWQHDMAVGRTREAAMRAATLTSLVVNEPMVLGDNEGTTAQFAKIAAAGDKSRVFLTDFRGSVTYGTDPAALGRRLTDTVADPGLAALLDQALGQGQDADSLEDVAGRPTFLTIRAVKNAPECHHCHGASRAVLGALVTAEDVSPEMAALRNTQVKAGLLSLAGLAALVAALWFFMKRSIIDRLAFLSSHSERIATGDMDACLEIHKRVDRRMTGGRMDEITTLANALCTLVDNLKRKILEADQKTREAASEAERAGTCLAEAESAREGAIAARREGAVAAAHTLEGVLANLGQTGEALYEKVRLALGGARTQKDAAQETTLAIGEMNTVVMEVAKNAAAAADTATDARQKAADGSRTVLELVTLISRIRDKAGALREDITALGQEAQGIGAIINVISDIADQTNLLALNAAIEAARAGDAGRGFAVVADEVRKLAEKTMTATKEVEQAVTAIQCGTREHVVSVQETATAIEAADTLARRSGEALSGIVGLVTASADQVQAIATAADEQSAVTEEIARTVESIHRISLDTAAAMEESDTAVARLTGQAADLRQLIDDMLA